MSQIMMNFPNAFKKEKNYMAQLIAQLIMLDNINCKGILHGIKAVLPGMKERRNGTIINISSIAGKKNFA